MQFISITLKLLGKMFIIYISKIRQSKQNYYRVSKKYRKLQI